MERCMCIFLLLIVCILIQDSRCDQRRGISIPSSYRFNHLHTQGTTSLRREEKLHFFKDYRRYEQIEKFMGRLVRQNSSIAKVFSIGKSVEGRKLNVIQIGSDSKPAIWIDGGTHAREWISPTTVMYIAYKLITEYSKSSRKNENDTVFNFSWYILPVVNPDGYEYSHEKDRMWRKNRNTKNEKCPGVDLNRNWGFHWNEDGSSEDACSDLYAGESAFSEPETRAISNFLSKKMKTQKIVAFLTFHSFGQLWVYPWGWTQSLPEDHKDLEKVAKKATDAIYKVNGTIYEVGPVTRSLDTVSGASLDWAKGEAGIKYSYAVELPNKRKHGFKLPKRYILPTGRELWAGVKAFANAIAPQNEEY